MKTLIEETNRKLKEIISDLSDKTNEVEDSLKEVQDKIDAKIEEAREYKLEVDKSKSEIKRLEDEISGLEEDLNDLNVRFSNKDLNAILETGNKEINAKIIDRQKLISKQKERINEYTEKARTIKDLLINLKKEKEGKKDKLDNYTECLSFYDKELTKIIEFSNENPDSLNEKVIEEPIEHEKETVDNYNFNNDIVIDDKPIFDVIESIEKENDYNYSDDESDNETSDEDNASGVSFTKDNNQEQDKEETKEPSNILPDLNLFKINNFLEDNRQIEENQNDSNDNNNQIEESNEENALNKELIASNDLFNNLTQSNELKTDNQIDFKALNESIDKEYADIFGNSDDIKIPEDNYTLKDDNNNIFNNNNLFGIDSNYPNIFENNFLNDTSVENDISTQNNTSLNATNNETEEFFSNNNLNFDKFNIDDQTNLKENFNLINYTKTLDILRKNNIKLDSVYNAPDIFNINHNELETIITKLLLAGQTTKNISYVLNTLPLIKSIDLQDVIDSYGENIKDANITDLIIKAKHLNEIGGGK